MSRPDGFELAEKSFQTINGCRQGMFLRARDATKPVLLYLHGGLPELFLARRFAPELESEFVVCWWEQRGSGLSYQTGMSPGSVTTEQLISDTLTVTDHLRQRFGTDRIFLLGHSGGSYLGLLAVDRSPDRYHAYVGVGQMANQLRSEISAYDYMLERCRREGRRRLARRLEDFPVTLDHGLAAGYERVRDKAMHELGIGTMHTMHSLVTGLFLPSLLCRDYTVAERINLWRGKAAMGVSSMWAEMLATDLSERVPRVDVPVYLLHGVHDGTCGYTEALTYFRSLQAPLKGFYRFTRSAHSPLFEEPAKAIEILRADVRSGSNRLADLT